MRHLNKVLAPGMADPWDDRGSAPWGYTHIKPYTGRLVLARILPLRAGWGGAGWVGGSVRQSISVEPNRP